MSSHDAIFSVCSHANMFDHNNIMFIKGDSCNLENIRKHMLTRFIGYEKSGVKPYEKFLYQGVIKFGMYCWEDKRSTFDVNQHVRYCPGMEDPTRAYSGSELLTVISVLFDKEWDNDRPNWEVLVVPRVKLENSLEIYYSLIFRCSHGYLDGIALFNCVQKCFFDELKEKEDDHTSPFIPRVSFLTKVIHPFQVLITLPYTLLQFFSNKPQTTFYQRDQTQLKGPKLIGFSKSQIPSEMISRIRKSLKCSTNALFNSAFCGALIQMAQKKNLPIPKEIYGSLPSAKLPYPNEYPQNRFSFTVQTYPIGIIDSLERLSAFNKIATNYQKLNVDLTSGWILNIISGALPASIVKRIWKMLRPSYVFSNNPGPVDELSFNGDKIVQMYNLMAVFNTAGYGIMVSSFQGNYTACFTVEKSKVVSNSQELDELIRAFEEEIFILDKISKSTSSDYIDKRIV